MPRRTAVNRVKVAREPLPPKLPERLVKTAGPPEHDVVDDAVLDSLHLADTDFAGRRAESVEFDRCRLDRVRLAGAVLERVVVSDCVFDECDLANLQSRAGSWLRVVFSGTRLTGLRWSDVRVRDVTFSSCRMDLASFRFADVGSTVFSNCNLAQADFQGADLRGARFVDCDLTAAEFSQAELEGTRFAGCNLAGIGGVTSLRGAVFGAVDLPALGSMLAAAMGIVVES